MHYKTDVRREMLKMPGKRAMLSPWARCSMVLAVLILAEGVCMAGGDLFGIWRAAEDGDLTAVKRELRRNPRLLNADVFKGQRMGTPLMWSVPCLHGITPQQLAQRNMKKLAVMRYLLKKGAAVNNNDHGSAALDWAVQRYNICPEALEILLKAGANPNDGMLILIRNDYASREKILAILLKHGLRLKPSTPLKVKGKLYRDWAEYAEAVAAVCKSSGLDASKKLEFAQYLRSLQEGSPSAAPAFVLPTDIERGKSLCDQADAFLKGGKPADALKLYQEALSLLPQSPRAKKGVSECRAALGTDAR